MLAPWEPPISDILLSESHLVAMDTCSCRSTLATLNCAHRFLGSQSRCSFVITDTACTVLYFLLNLKLMQLARALVMPPRGYNGEYRKIVCVAVTTGLRPNTRNQIGRNRKSK